MDLKRLGFFIVLFLCSSFALRALGASGVQFEKEYERICEPALKALHQKPFQGIPGQFSNSQLLEYCQTAHAQKKSTQAQSKLISIWTAVAAVCTSTCVLSLTNQFTKPLVCMSAHGTGTVTDALLTRQFQEAIMGVGKLVMSSALNNKLNSPNSKDQKKDFGACALAATAGIQAFTKKSSKETAQAGFEATVQSILNLESQTRGTNTAGLGPLKQNLSSQAALGTSQHVVTENFTSDPSSDPCQNNLTLSCAISAEPTLPPFVSNPEFETEVKKLTGQPIENVFGKNKNAPIGKVMAKGFGSQIQSRHLKAFEGITNQLQRRLAHITEDSFYFGGTGKSKTSSETKPEKDFSAVVGSLLDGLTQENSETNVTPIHAIDFTESQSGVSRDLASESQASLFERVTSCYLKIEKMRDSQ